MNRNSYDIAVIGAGAFGGWAAYRLLQTGANVLLADTWGPGNSRASSGGETRLIRATYGPDAIYTRMAARALEVWKDSERLLGRKLYHRTGLVWMVTADDDSYERAALDSLIECGVAFERLTTDEAKSRFPQINFDGVRWVIYEHDAGYLTARQACDRVASAFVAQGGEYQQVSVSPGPIASERMLWVELSDGSRVTADSFLFACGPWLPQVFPGLLGKLIQPTRQEVFFFGPPAGSDAYNEGVMPAWVDHGEAFLYGMPGNQLRGFKAADDTRGQQFQPTSGERVPSIDGVRRVRSFVERRFPGLKGAPVVDARVCQYEDTPDRHFIIDCHPEADNVWIAGGGSGHGFKHGPAVGEYVASLIRGETETEPTFALARFKD